MKSWLLVHILFTHTFVVLYLIEKYSSQTEYFFQIQSKLLYISVIQIKASCRKGSDYIFMERYHVFITVLSLAVVSIITAFLLTITLPGHNPFVEEESGVNLRQSGIPVPGISSVENSKSYAYILKEYQGKLAVYIPGQAQPQKIFNVYLSTLPPFDRTQLQEGIEIQNYEELVRRIEDYIS